jgi:tetratricopeptide (TPR) repeat protein
LRGDFADAQVQIRASQAVLGELGQEAMLASSTQEAGTALLLAGDLGGARAQFQRGFDELGRMGEKPYRGTNTALLGRAVYESGHAEEALEFLDLGEDESGGQETVKQETYPVRALIAADRGEVDAARSFIDQARASVETSDLLTARGHIEVQAVRVFEKLGLAEERDEALRKATDICGRKEAPALLRLVGAS